MGRFENQPNPQSNGDASSDARIMRTLIEELQALQQSVLKSLQEDIKRLQNEKHRLAEDIQQLQVKKNNLQHEQLEAEQQVLIRQLVQVLANHVGVQLQSTLENLFESAMLNQQGIRSHNALSTDNVAQSARADTEQMLGSLHNTLASTFEQLQADLNNYQSNFHSSLSRMYGEQARGEMIIAELVHRLRQELESPNQMPKAEIEAVQQIEFEETSENTLFRRTNGSIESSVSARDESSTEVVDVDAEAESPFVEVIPPPGYKFPDTVIPNPVTRAQVEAKLESEFRPQAIVATPVVTPISPEPARQRYSEPQQQPQSRQPENLNNSSPTMVGLLLVVLATVVSALYNVTIRALFLPRSQIFGAFDVQQLISPTLGNCLLILMLRMLVVVPLMLVLAPILHPRIWEDMKSLVSSIGRSKRRNTTQTGTISKPVLLLSIATGFFLFLSQVLIYLAIGQIQTGIALALFFIYPIITGLLSWLLLGSQSKKEPKSLFKISAVACILLGQLLVLSTNIGNISITNGGIAALASGVAFAVYVILTRICAAKIHPVSFTLLNFTTMLVLCFIGLLIPLPANLGVQVTNAYNLMELVLSAFILGVLTLVGYLLNNIGIRKFGATRSALIGACVPAVTVIFAGIIIQESLQLIQIVGVLIVTLGAAAISLDKIRNRLKVYRATN
jgi:drug/metabolite transporter (DMT)-like permease